MRGSLTGSVVSNILLVLGAAMIAGGDGKVDTRSLRWQLARGLRRGRCCSLIPSVPRWHGGSPDRHSLYLLSIPVSIVLLVRYVVITSATCASTARPSGDEPSARRLVAAKRDRRCSPWRRLATAFVSEMLVHSLDHFGQAVGLNEFFIAVVIVAIVGNAAEHGGAVVIARRGNTELATEIAITSSMQVAVFVTPAVCLLSWLVGRGLPLSFRVVEIATMAGRGRVRDARRSGTAARAAGRASCSSASTALPSSPTALVPGVDR